MGEEKRQEKEGKWEKEGGEKMNRENVRVKR